MVPDLKPTLRSSEQTVLKKFFTFKETVAEQHGIVVALFELEALKSSTNSLSALHVSCCWDYMTVTWQLFMC